MPTGPLPTMQTYVFKGFVFILVVKNLFINQIIVLNGWQLLKILILLILY